MTQRKGEIRLARVKVKWPYHVALPAYRVEGENHDIVRGFASMFALAPLEYALQRDNVDHVVFCFAKPEDAEVFCQRFGGERLPG
jgi:hypothetical protein